jgi:hypothetical protein
MLYYRRRTRRILKQIYGKATRKQGRNSRGGRRGGGVSVVVEVEDVAVVRCELGSERE